MIITPGKRFYAVYSALNRSVSSGYSLLDKVESAAYLQQVLMPKTSVMATLIHFDFYFVAFNKKKTPKMMFLVTF